MDNLFWVIVGYCFTIKVSPSVLYLNCTLFSGPMTSAASPTTTMYNPSTSFQFTTPGPGKTIQVNLDMTDSMGPGKLVRHMQNLSYTYD